MTTSLAAQARRTRCQVRRGRHRENGAVPRSAPARHLRGPRHRDRPESCGVEHHHPAPTSPRYPNTWMRENTCSYPIIWGQCISKVGPLSQRSHGAGYAPDDPPNSNEPCDAANPKPAYDDDYPPPQLLPPPKWSPAGWLAHPKHLLGVHLRTLRAPSMDATDGRDSPTSLDHYRIPIPEPGNSTRQLHNLPVRTSVRPAEHEVLEP